MSGAVIAGIGMHPFGRFGATSVAQMGSVAVERALRDAEIEPSRIGATFCATVYSGVATGHRVLAQLGMTGGPIVDVEAGCASGGAALQLAVDAVLSGQHEAVLVVGVEKMPRGIIRSSFFAPWQEAAGFSPAPAYFAMRAQRLLREQGLDKNDLARLVVKNRAAGAHNSDAMFRAAVTVEQVLASTLVCDPLHLWMLCSPNEGAAAVVVRRAKGNARDVHIAGIALRSHRPGSILGEDTPLCGVDDTAIVPPTTSAAQAAYAQAGIGPADLDIVECQDTDAARELMVWTELGLCAPGDQRALLAGGEAEPGGARPINPSGGLLSKGEPLGASALGQVCELVTQLRGEAGPRQVKPSRTAMAHVIGRGANACVTVLKR
ncbi:MAG: thiolase family protein [Pseudomonadota bacterium]